LCETIKPQQNIIPATRARE